MGVYPLTFAVFYQAIIKPNARLDQYRSIHVLLRGELLDMIKDRTDLPSPGTYSEYVKGKRPVRKESVNEICGLEPERLVDRIIMLGLQDMPAVMDAVKNLLKISDISEQLSKELIAEADTTDNRELFLAKMFQLSLKRSNKARKLTQEDISILMEIRRFGSDVELNEIMYEKEEPEESEKSEEPEQTVGEQYPNNRGHFKEEHKEIEQLLFGYREASEELKRFRGKYVSYQEVNLPDDFEAFITRVAPVAVEPMHIYLDFADIMAVCHLDLDKKICKDGQIKIIEIVCGFEDTDFIKTAISVINEKDDCLVVISMSEGGGLNEMSQVADLICEMASDGNTIFGGRIDETQLSDLRIQIFWRSDVPETKEEEKSTHTLPPVFKVVKVDSENQKPRELQIPNLWNNTK